MTSGKHLLTSSLGLALLLAGCGGGGGGGSNSALLSATQDLGLDPDGFTTVLVFSGEVPLTVAPGSFSASANQLPSTVSVDGNEVTIVWDERVTPVHEISVAASSGVSAGGTAVETSDDSAPSFTVVSAEQNPGSGTDQLVLDFSGPRLVAAQAEDADFWQLFLDDTAVDLAGSSFDLDSSTQVLTLTLAAGLGLHGDFEIAAVGLTSVADVAVDDERVAGMATGDSSAPTLLSALQNLDEDEFGRVVDFSFDEPMDATFNGALANFQADLPVFATAVEQVSEQVFRVHFTGPIVPGVDSIDLGELLDVHGNASSAGSTAISAGSLLANDFSETPELLAVPNQGGDYLVVSFDQAFDPESAEDSDHWVLECPVGVAVDLSVLDFDYQLLDKTLTIELPDDYPYGQSAYFAAAVGDGAIEVDGEQFGGDASFSVTGDDQGPALSSAVQNRTLDTLGKTLELLFAEDVEASSAQNSANYSCSGSQGVVSATLMPNRRTVRLVLDAAMVPGTDSLDLELVEDLAGNPMSALVAQVLSSSDSDAPLPSAQTAEAVAGLDNDTVYVLFDDAMVEDEVEDVDNWSFESPIGTVFDTSLASVVYDANTRGATLTFDGGDGLNLHVADDFQVSFANMRDLGGNEVQAVDLTGSVGGEDGLPELDSCWVEDAFANHVHVRFSEPCDALDDLYDASTNPYGATEYLVRHSSGVLKGVPSSVILDVDGLGAELVFGFTVSAGSDTLDVVGVIDLAGNPLFPVLSHAIDVEDPAEPDLNLGFSTALTVSGEDNDLLTLSFDRGLSSWGFTDPDNYQLELLGNAVDLSGASFTRTAADTLEIAFDGQGAASLATGASYDLEVSGLSSAQGVLMSLTASDALVPSGDITGPALPVGSVRLDPLAPATSVLIDFSEAVDPDDAADTGLIDIGSVNPDSVQLLGARSMRATWSGGVSVAQTVNVALRDLAGNLGAVSRAITAADSVGPLVSSVAGEIGVGRGGDRLIVSFNEPVSLGGALNSANYSASSGSLTLDLGSANFRYQSSNNAVVIELPAGVELLAGEALSISVSGVTDHSDNEMNPPATVGGPVSGDTTPPDFLAAYVNYRKDSFGLVVDVRFTEDVDAAYVADTANWTVSSGQSVLAVSFVRADVLRLSLSSALGAGALLELNSLPDTAGNTSGAIDIEPLR